MRTLLAEPSPPVFSETISAKPRLGFLGVDGPGRGRLEAIAKSGIAEITAIADDSRELANEMARIEPRAEVLDSLDDFWEVGVDGVVIATPSALHAEQATAALERGMAVFCQKPIGRTAAETRQVIETARRADLLLGTDFSYRFISGIQKIHELCVSGELGEIFSADLIFHNSCGPDKPWFYDLALSGGGCVIDLGVHLIDLALWNLGFPRITNVTSRLFAHGYPILGRSREVEDYAIAHLDLENGATIRLTCSWKLPAGCDAIISGSFYGTKGGAAFHNVDGSFYDFVAKHSRGTKCKTLACEPESWDGRAAMDWAQRLARGEKFNGEIETAATVAEAVDAIYASSGRKSVA